MNSYRYPNTNGAILTIYSMDANTGRRLGSADFELLSLGQPVTKGTTNSRGTLNLCIPKSGEYTLRESSPPFGYMANCEVFNICMGKCGCLFINGRSGSHITIKNAAELRADFTALKVNIADDKPLGGAKFTLFKGSLPVKYAVSSQTGAVMFSGLLPGAYELVEVESPLGFENNYVRLPVKVSQNGMVTINGHPANGFRFVNIPLNYESKTPLLHQIINGSDKITGTGVPGAEIKVTFPDGNTVTAIVNPNGYWTANVPAGLTLKTGDEVSAVQTEQGKPESERVIEVVVVEPNVYGYKLLKNLSRVLNYGAGDILEFMITVGNDTSTTTTWPNIEVTDRIHEFTTFMSGSVRVNGIRSRIGSGINEYSYDTDTRVLRLYLGDIYPWDEVVIRYRVRINNDWTGTPFNNNFNANPVSTGFGVRNGKVSLSGGVEIIPDRTPVKE